MARTSNGTEPKKIRCAIYTRKSTDEGLNQEFNSLDAQREAGEAYILSQAGEGWTCLTDRFDDGGYTGANMDRPALKQLLSAIEAGQLDCVVVYKVDRLSRSIRDFARMMELFEKHGISFVSVTQQFNTTNSLGRLTLNILLSFAQFEREIISERTRDKQIAARRKGKWTGGPLILGYDLDPAASRLVINAEEAERVRSIFDWYLAGEPVSHIAQKAHRLGWRNKQWVTREGNTYGGHPLRRTHLYNLLANPLYAGRIRADGELVEAEHDAIIDPAKFDLVQARLKERSTANSNQHRTKLQSLLRGLIYCSCCGSGMYQTYSTSRERRYRYYVCSRAQRKTDDYCVTKSVSAPAVEDAVVESIRRIGVHPRVLGETERLIRERFAEDAYQLREERSTLQTSIKNLKSQLARVRNPARRAAFEDQIAAESRAEELKREIEISECEAPDEKDLRKTMEAFDPLWRAMNVQQQAELLRQLIEKVGYDGRTGKVTVSFRSAGVKKLCQK